MELLEAVRARKSIRAFLPTPIPKDILAQLLEVAVLSPSSLNTQPWEIVVLAGEALEELRRTNVRQLSAGAVPCPDIPSERPAGVYRERQIALAKELFRLLGIAREDREKRAAWDEKQVRFFDAPAVLVIAVDRSTAPRSFFDVGMLSQTIALAAQHYGLGTCVQQAGVNYPDLIRRACGLADSRLVVMAIALGYPDWDQPVNTIRTQRELEGVITWRTE